MSQTAYTTAQPPRALRPAKPSDPCLESSAATLVTPDADEIPPTPASPFSASFDPNGPPPQAGAFPFAQQAYQPPSVPRRSAARGAPPNVVWARSLSSSFSTIAEQLAAASRTLAERDALAQASDDEPEHADNALAARLDAVERAQARLGEDLEVVRAHLERLHLNTGKAVELSLEPAVDVDVQALQRTVDELAARLRLNESQMYARLQNARATANKMAVVPLVTTGGKAPPNFPATRGEFEHLTKERYEQLLTAYGLPLKGDTAAKREAMREFLGLPR